MTTMQVQDIKRKKSVSTRYAPNSYRIFDESINNQSLPHQQVYMHQEPQIYTQPLIVPAQAIEERNHPHAGRNAGFLRENVQSLNEPINNIQTRNDIQSDEGKKWWEWNTPKDEMDSALKNKKRLGALNNYVNPSDLNSYATTYQKDMGYLNNVLEPGTKVGGFNENNGAAQRYTYNNEANQAVGIVPVNDLNSFSKNGEPQRVFVDKMSFEHAYDSRKDNNYNQRGRRQGGFVVEQQESRQPVTVKVNRPDSNAGSSVWNAMHPGDAKEEFQSRQTSGLRKVVPPSAQTEANKRRDPIGYFNDDKTGGSYSQNGIHNNNFSQVPNNMTQYQSAPMAPVNQEPYQPSWNGRYDEQPGSQQNPDELLDHAMNPYQNQQQNGY